jgi:LmbE family N-acetylglucosaminyl deacetylase
MPRHILCIGAHPDDNEWHIGGTAALFRARGDTVRFVSVTNGNKGHFAQEYQTNPDALAHRRHQEALAAAAVIGAEYETLGIPDGEVYITPSHTEAMIRLIRQFGPPGQGPDLVLLNRPNDYHRDHRYSAQLVLDATYMLTVPLMCPGIRHLDRMPIFAYWADTFTEGGLFQPQVIISIDSVLEQKIDMVCAHESQFFEWLPYNRGALAHFPADPRARRAFVADICKERAAECRQSCIYQMASPHLLESIQYVEAFQVSEYGRRPTENELKELFPSPILNVESD